MDTNVLLGSIVIGIALLAIVVLVLWSRRKIETIAGNGYRTARQTLKERKQ